VSRRPLTFVVILSVIPLLAVVGGCSSRDGTLDGTSWRLTEWTLSSLDPADFTITAQFEDGRISGNSGVNTYGGPVKLGPGEAFSLGRVSATEMAGDESAMRAESAYLTLLGQARSYRVSGTTLTLYDEGGNESLIFEVAKNQGT
jgi:heat shock protein HslJ